MDYNDINELYKHRPLHPGVIHDFISEALEADIATMKAARWMKMEDVNKKNLQHSQIRLLLAFLEGVENEVPSESEDTKTRSGLIDRVKRALRSLFSWQTEP